MTSRTEFHHQFLKSDRKHILMITNHGIHQWNVVPGLTDTGGQNIYVNNFTHTLAKLGYKITIANRGGYPHPVTNEPQTGLHYLNSHQRLLYLEDNQKKFIRKEDMLPQISQLAKYLHTFLQHENNLPDLIISHYWDAALLGNLYNQHISNPAPHYWVPHSLGAIKKRHVNSERWAELKINQRITTEKKLIKDLTGIVATSSLIRESLNSDYNYKTKLFLPPGIDSHRFQPHQVDQNNPVWQYLSDQIRLSIPQIKKHKIITEISRTDTTKRKDILLQAFAQVHRQHPQTILVTTADPKVKKVYQQLQKLINKLKLNKQVVVAGHIPDLLPDLYAVTDIYCSPSIMEGFGMAVQEAAATKVPVVGSDKIPFLTEYLVGKNPKQLKVPHTTLKITQGKGCIIAPSDHPDSFAFAINTLLQDNKLRKQMGRKAYRNTIPRFTWPVLVKNFLKQIKL